MSRAPTYSVERCPPPGTAHTKIFAAVRIALKYPSRTPSREELMRDWGMSRAAATRWRAAFKAARGEPAGRNAGIASQPTQPGTGARQT